MMTRKLTTNELKVCPQLVEACQALIVKVDNPPDPDSPNEVITGYEAQLRTHFERMRTYVEKIEAIRVDLDRKARE